MTRAAGAQSAPSGFAGIDAKGSGEDGTNMVKATQRPSGDQVSDPGERCRFVSRALCPVSIHRTQSWVEPTPSEKRNVTVPLGSPLMQAASHIAARRRSGRAAHGSLAIRRVANVVRGAMVGLSGWLAELGLEEFLPQFESNQVELDDVPHLAADDLREIGLPGMRPPVIRAPKSCKSKRKM